MAQDLDLQAENAGEMISPVPLSSTLKTSISDDFSRLRILHVPSSWIVVLSPATVSLDPVCFFLSS